MNHLEREFFQRNGYLLIENALQEDECDHLRAIIDSLDSTMRQKKGRKHIVHKCIFVQHPEICLRIFKNDRVLPTISSLIASAGSSRRGDSGLQAHVIHNNAFCIRPGNRGQATNWRTDDPPIFVDLTGTGSGSIPERITIAPLVLTCMYYLNDLRGAVDGMAHLIPGSHRFTRPCTNKEAEQMPHIAPAVPKGTVLIISPYLWHRGADVPPEGNARYLFQVTYGRRLVGHKFGSIMNYQLPERVQRLLITEEDRKLMGFMQGGAYS